MEKTEKEKKMRKLEKDFLDYCKKDSLYKEGTHPVFGEGSLDAKIMLIGEAPGFNEALTGHPFCGAAGKILDELLDSIGLHRNEIYIANILKLRPPGNRNPLAKEIEIHALYLDKQIEIIKPKVLCVLGNYSTVYIMKKYGLQDEIYGISKIRGKIFTAKTLFGSVKIIPLYHPAVATYNMNMKVILKQDFQVLQNFK